MEPVVVTPVTATANLRRATVISAGLAVIAIVATSIAGHPLMGIFAALGLALGAVNNRMLQKSVIMRGTGVYTRKRFNGGVFGRLGLVTLVSFGTALLIRPDGLATVAGVAVFHALMLVGAATPVFRSLRPQV